MKLSEIKNEEALDLLGDLLEPVAEILADPKVKEMFGGKPIKLASYIIKTHKTEIIQILARMDGVPVEEYTCNVFTLPVKVLELLNDENLKELFTLQAQMSE